MGMVSRELEDKIIAAVLGRLAPVSYNADKAPAKLAYTPNAYMNDIYDFVFTPTIQGRTLSATEKKLQLALLSRVIGGANVEKTSASRGGFRMLIDVPEAVKAKSVAYYGALSNLSRPLAERQGFSYYVDIDPKQADMAPYYYDLMKRARQLLQGKASSGSADTQQHYKFLLHKLEQAMR